MKLVDNPREIWKKYSTHALSALTILPVLWKQFPEIRAIMSPETALQVTGWIALAGLIGRFISQTAKK